MKLLIKQLVKVSELVFFTLLISFNSGNSSNCRKILNVNKSISNKIDFTECDEASIELSDSLYQVANLLRLHGKNSTFGYWIMNNKIDLNKEKLVILEGDGVLKGDFILVIGKSLRDDKMSGIEDFYFSEVTL
jgi:hypothetical protein